MFAENHELFPFKTIKDVLEENQKLKEEVECLNDVISSNISDFLEELRIVQAEYDNLQAQHVELKTEFDNLKSEYDAFGIKHEQDLAALRNEMTQMIVSFLCFNLSLMLYTCPICRAAELGVQEKEIFKYIFLNFRINEYFNLHLMQK